MDIIRQRIQPVAQAVTAQRFVVYALLSTLAVVGVIANACRTYSNFYSVAIYLSKSGRSVVVIACSYTITILRIDATMTVSGKLLLSSSFVMRENHAASLLWAFTTPGG